MRYRLLGKMVSFWEAFSGKRFDCCTLIVLYSIYSTVGRSIASISNLDGIFTLGLIRISTIDLPTVLYILHISTEGIDHLYKRTDMQSIAITPVVYRLTVNSSYIVIKWRGEVLVVCSMLMCWCLPERLTGIAVQHDSPLFVLSLWRRGTGYGRGPERLPPSGSTRRRMPNSSHLPQNAQYLTAVMICISCLCVYVRTFFKSVRI